MAQTNYSKTFGKALRANGVSSREQYQLEAVFNVKRGEELSQSKLTDDDVRLIHDAKVNREALRDHIRLSLSNEALARQFGVHVRTIEKVLSYGSWRHVK